MMRSFRYLLKVKKEMVDFVKDEGPRAGTTAESLSQVTMLLW